jgi:hypothetical protein
MRFRQIFVYIHLLIRAYEGNEFNFKNLIILNLDESKTFGNVLVTFSSQFSGRL